MQNFPTFKFLTQFLRSAINIEYNNHEQLNKVRSMTVQSTAQTNDRGEEGTEDSGTEWNGAEELAPYPKSAPLKP